MFSVKSISSKILPTVATSWISAKRLVARSRVHMAKSVTRREVTPAVQRAVLNSDIIVSSFWDSLQVQLHELGGFPSQGWFST